MKKLIVFLAMFVFIYCIGFLFRCKYKPKYEFMPFEHSTAYRAVAALIIMMQHVPGGFGVRYFTPLGGVGVAIFLISSGYGLNKSYKCRGIHGGIGNLRLLRL